MSNYLVKFLSGEGEYRVRARNKDSALLIAKKIARHYGHLVNDETLASVAPSEYLPRFTDIQRAKGF